MRVSLKAMYGILATLDLALQNGSAPVQSKAIAKRQAIPLRFLEQVLNAMKQGGLVNSLRGAQGGYTLRKKPAEISLAEIVETLDGPLVPPFNRSSAPRLRGQMKPDALLGSVWERMYQAQLSVLSTVTLKELAERQRQLEQQKTLMYHI
ncbi:MAG: RrF2 family transcriptional regulator [Nitrospira sp.]|nr:Rrf2 family transcriptional regulator [Nitrospira sp.]